MKAINEIRENAGVRKLAVSSALTRIARAHSEDQARRGRSGHEGSGGTTPAERAQRAGVDYHAIGENVAMNYGYEVPVAVAVQGWMESKHHRENILNPIYVETGVGVASGSDGKIYLTQVFLDPPAAR